MEEGKEHIHNSAEYLRKYLDGELSGPEMQALEKAALEDPFLSDALEGLESSEHNRSSLTCDLTDLQQRLANRITIKNRKKGILFRLTNWQVAAAVFFIIGAAIFTYTLINKGADQTKIAVSTQSDSRASKSEPAPLAIAPDSSKPEKIKVIPDLSKTDSEEFAYKPAAKEKKSRVHYENTRKPIPATERANGYSALRAEEPAMDSRPEQEKTSSIAKNEDSVYVPSSKNKETALQGKVAGLPVQSGSGNNGRYVEGVVLDTAGNPIPSATITVSGTKNATVTDANGVFRIYLNKGNNANDIAIQSMGYESYTGKLSPGGYDSNTYRLRSAASLNEVVVKGYAAVKRKDITGSVVQVNVKNSNLPMGWDSLYYYIETNKKITTTDSVLKGEEVISFVVSKKGELSSFKIIKSVSPVHDAEIIRLIKSGPPLKIQKGRKQKCTMSILFN
jgi:CarboxypepD_reg-like domain